MNTLVVDVSEETYRLLEERARSAGKAPEVLGRELIERALRGSDLPVPRSARDVLEMADRTRPLSDTLRQRIIPGVTLDEVRTAVLEAGGRSLSEIVLEQRGAKQ
jgi:hypothetical protein